LQGIEKVRKRYLIAAAAHNLGCLMRALFPMGTPKSLQAFVDLASSLYFAIVTLCRVPTARFRIPGPRMIHRRRRNRAAGPTLPLRNIRFSTGC
jgi:hypothetical protein